jgi:phospholipid/cholesterol/gamma-HCH transport system ATP-binding protein
MEALEEDEIVTIRNLSKSFVGNDILKGVDLNVRKRKMWWCLENPGREIDTYQMHGWPGGSGRRRNICFWKDILGMTYRELNETRVRMGFLFQSAALYDSMSVRRTWLFHCGNIKRLFAGKNRIPHNGSIG